MGIKEDYNQAVQLVKQGKYEQARRLLIVHEHPKANVLLAKINDVMANTGDKPKRKTDALDMIVGIINAFVTAGLILWWGVWIDNSIAFDLEDNPIIYVVLFAAWLSLMYIINRLYKRIRQ